MTTVLETRAASLMFGRSGYLILNLEGFGSPAYYLDCFMNTSRCRVRQARSRTQPAQDSGAVCRYQSRHREEPDSPVVMKLLHIQLGMILALALLLPEASAQS